MRLNPLAYHYCRYGTSVVFSSPLLDLFLSAVACAQVLRRAELVTVEVFQSDTLNLLADFVCKLQTLSRGTATTLTLMLTAKSCNATIIAWRILSSPM